MLKDLKCIVRLEILSVFYVYGYKVYFMFRDIYRIVSSGLSSLLYVQGHKDILHV